MTILTGGPGDESFDVTLGDGVTSVDGGGGVDTLNADWSAASDSIVTTIDIANPGSLLDPVTGDTLAISNIQRLALRTGSSDDLLNVTGSAVIATWDGGGGTNTFNGDFTDSTANLSFTLNTTPGSSSTVLGQGSVVTNVQVIDIHGGLGNDTLVGGNGDDSLYGGNGDDFVSGGAGNDLIEGGLGNDTLIGGLGDDLFRVYSSSTVVVEAPGEGNDTVLATLNYTLPTNVENLQLLGNPAYGGGNALDNVLTGAAGAQTLDGMAGNDTLTGGTGNDVFIMGQGYGHDVITDFEPGIDRVRLDNMGLTTFSQVQAAMTQQGADVALNLGSGDQLLFSSHQVSDFSAADFMLPLDTSRLHPTFTDDFNSLSLFKSGKGGTWWTVFGSGGGAVFNHTLPGNGEKELYVDPSYTGTGTTPLGLNPFSISNGVLNITADQAPAAALPFLAGYQYTSGLLNTKTTFAQQYGYFEVRAKLPAGDGLWPAIWLLPANFTSTPEIDIMEQLGKDPSTIYQTAHTKLPGYNYTSSAVHLANPDQFHTFGMRWDKNYIVWYVDGVETSRAPTAADMNTPMYLLIDLAVGGNFPGNPDSTTPFPSSMSIDYVHVYSLSDIAPTAIGDSYSVTQDSVLSVAAARGLTANDTDPDPTDGNWLSGVLVAGPAHGSVTMGARGAFTYTPKAGYVGSDSFTYAASDGLGQSAPATVNLTVNLANQAPTATIAQASLSATEQTPLDLKAAGLSISDPDAGSGVMTVTLSVGEGILTVSAGSSGATVTSSGTSAVTITGTTAQIDALLGADPASTVSYADNTDTPSASTTLTLLVHDNGNTGGGGDKSGSASATITITAVNDPPVADDDSATASYNTPLVLQQSALVANDSDPEGNVLTVSAVAGAQHGSVSLSGGQITFTPAAGYVGPAGFSYTVSDGNGGAATANVAVQVTPPPPPWVSASAPSATLIEQGAGVAGIATSTATLTEGGGWSAPSYVLTGWKAAGAGLYSEAGTYGSAVLDTVHNTLTYTLNNSSTPTNALAGGQAVSDSFTVNVTDGHTGASTAVAFAITGTNDSPIARSDQTNAAYNTPLVLQPATLLANDADADGGALTITAVGAAQHGTVAVSPTGVVTFTPFFGYVGFARFSYTVSDGHGGSGTGFVGVNVTSTTGTNVGPPYVYVAGSHTGQTVDVSGDGIAHIVIGSNFNDFIYGGASKDTLNGGPGNDLINGGAGNDLISGGPGSDTLYGAAGSDNFSWSLADLLSSPAGTQDGVLDFEGAGDGRASGDYLIFTGFSPQSTLTLQSHSHASPNLYYYTLTDHASGASQLIALNSVDGLALAKGDYLFL